MADAALAKFWRQHQADQKSGSSNKNADVYEDTSSSSSWTKLHRIVQLPQCRRFLITQQNIWASHVAAHPADAEGHATYASFCEKLGDFVTAATEWGLAAQMCPQTSYEYHYVRVQRQLEAFHAQKTLSVSNLPSHVTQSVVRKKVSELSYKDFMLNFAYKGIPVILTEMSLTTKPWTLDYLRSLIGDKVVPVRRALKDSVLWAKLEDAGELTVAQFIDGMNGDTATSYVHDWGLPGQCDALLEDLTIPKYFLGDVLQHLPEGSIYRDSWPSLFIGPKGTESSLHVDTFRSNFWMALFEGRKRWVFFDPHDTPLLYPIYANGTLDPVFQVNANVPPSEQSAAFPLFQYAHSYECTLEPGEILFVPAGSPHFVENLTHSVAISGNYIDFSNFSASRAELHLMGFVDPRARELSAALRQPDLMLNVSAVLEDLALTFGSELALNPVGVKFAEMIPEDLPHLPFLKAKLLGYRATQLVQPKTLQQPESDEEDDGTEALFLTALARSRGSEKISQKKKSKIF